RRVRIGGTQAPVSDVLAELVALPHDAPVTPSVAAWAVAARTAVDLIARGRLRPARTPDGRTGWTVGPLDLADRQRLAELAAGLRIALPAGPDAGFEAVVQLRSQKDPSLVVDAAELWSAPAVVLERLGEDAEADLLLGLRRLSKVWSPAEALLDEARPEVLA